MRASRHAWALGLTLGLAGRAAGLEIDARSLGSGGTWVFSRLVASPGSPDSTAAGFAIGLDLATLYLGTDLTAAAVHLQRDAGRVRLAVACTQVRAPLGAETTAAAALQLHFGSLHGGVALAARSLRFDSISNRWEFAPRFGLGWGAGRLRAAGVLATEGTGWVQARLAGGVECRLTPHLVLRLQLEQFPGVVTGPRVGVEWQRAGCCLRAGWDDASAACTVGFGWRFAGQRFEWGARSHPELGWSHAWTYARP
jgi:hypothetical protein